MRNLVVAPFAQLNLLDSIIWETQLLHNVQESFQSIQEV